MNTMIEGIKAIIGLIFITAVLSGLFTYIGMKAAEWIETTK